ncbi:MAG: FAD-binding oxidoreductase [Spirochaetia bacterium]
MKSEYKYLTEEDFPILSDESRMPGRADRMFRPENESVLAAALSDLNGRGEPVTIQGGKTGITGGAVPADGTVIDTSGMNRITGDRSGESSEVFITAEPGVTLLELREYCGRKYPGFFFPPDPTEPSATLGGMASTNASGARSFRYGSVRNFINSAAVVLADGTVTDLARKKGHPDPGFEINSRQGRKMRLELPDVRSPGIKNAAGYYVRPGMDILDLFIGSEGTLGIFTSLTVRVVQEPRNILALFSFFPGEKEALDFSDLIRDFRMDKSGFIMAAEYFDRASLELIGREREERGILKDLPPFPADSGTGIYTELAAHSERDLERLLEKTARVLSSAGGDIEKTWTGEGWSGIGQFKEMRHAVPEEINRRIDGVRRKEPGITKLSTDLAVPKEKFRELMKLYRADLDRTGLEGIIFGHIGDCHVHVNIIPETLKEFASGKELCLKWASAAADMGGTVSAEHGIGKLKREFLRIMYPQEVLDKFRKIKETLDPGMILNRGNIFE